MILSRVPFRLSLGGGSTDMPSYYREYGGFIFAVSIDLYMDVLIKKPIVDDYVHMHYTHYETETDAENIKHTIGREALRMCGVKNKVLISFKADTPSGTGLGSSGACSVALLKGLSAYQGREMNNLEAAEQSFVLTQNLHLPDGKQDPYACALGGFSVLEIKKDGAVEARRPQIQKETRDAFVQRTALFYTGTRRDSKPLLDTQDKKKVLELKHMTKEIGRLILGDFEKGDLDAFGKRLDEHWNIKRKMNEGMTSVLFDEIYDAAKKAGALGGKIIGAGGGGYFMFYCPTEQIRGAVQSAMHAYTLRNVDFAIDDEGARIMEVDF